MVATFAEYASKARQSEVAVRLGELCWYTVNELTISHDDLVGHLERLGLGGYAPPKPNDADVFRRVSSAAARKRVPTDSTDRHQNFLIRELSRAGGNVSRRIVAETVDLKGRRLGYRELVKLEFDGATGKVTSEDMAAALTTEATVAREIADGIIRDYKAERGCLDSYGIRELIRKTLLSLNATVVRPGGGVYFVMAHRTDKVEALEHLARLVDGVSVHSLPLLDDGKQRDMLRRAVEAESIDEIDRTVGEIVEIVKSGADISHAKFADFQKRYTTVVAKTQEYAKLLEEGSATTSIRLDIYAREMAQLLGRVK